MVHFWAGRRLSLAAWVLALAAPAPLWGQDVKDVSPQNKSHLNALRDGKEAITAADKPILEQAAKFQLHRLTQEKYWRKPPPEGLTIDQMLEQDVFKYIPMPTQQKPLNENQQKFMEAVADAFLSPIEEALHHPEPIVRVNAARILARIAESGQEKTAPVLLKVLNEKDQWDAVKFWVFRGFEGLFNASWWNAAVPGNERPNHRAFKDEALENQSIQAIGDYILRKPTLSPNASEEEVKGIQYVRREAIRALGVTKLPAIIVKKQFIGTPTSLILCKVVANDGLSPSASLSERLEAAIGLAQLQTNLVDNYQPDYAAHIVGNFIVDLANVFNNAGGAAAQGTIRPYPWKLWATRLEEGLQAWKEANPKASGPSGEYIASLVDRFTTMIRTLQKAQGLANVNDLRAWLEKPPPNSSLFKNHPETNVKPPEPAEK
jgi:hypothetical protein